MLQFALLLTYTSAQAYKLLLDRFPLPGMSLLKRPSQGSVEPLKAVKLLVDNDKINKNLILLGDGMYLEKSLQYQGGKAIRSDKEGNLY